jgi:hypothetical protein
MRKVVLTFGLISGGIIALFLVIHMHLWSKGLLDFDTGELVGYSSMIIALSMVFFGIKSYRDNHQSGSITFLKGVQVGLLISLVASLVYAGTWEVYYQTNEEIKNSFMDKYTDYCITKMKKEGASPTEVEAKLKELTTMKEMYKNPLLRFGITVLELFPVGVLISLISAAILRKRTVLPA